MNILHNISLNDLKKIKTLKLYRLNRSYKESLKEHSTQSENYEKQEYQIIDSYQKEFPNKWYRRTYSLDEVESAIKDKLDNLITNITN